MSDDIYDNKVYAQLLRSIENFGQTDDAIVSDRTAMQSWSDFLSQNEVEICKYKKATLEVQQYLDAYDFSKEFDFSTMQCKIEALHPLRLKLVKMGEEAKKLSAFPDRYNSRKAIEMCKNLTLACREKMLLDESDKLSQLVESNTQKLMELQKLLIRDNGILQQIKAAVEADKQTLMKFRAYYAELMQYISDFPHSGVDDVAVVADRIVLAKRIDKLSLSVGNVVNGIRDYCDRYGKGKVMADYTNTVNAMTNTMKVSDTRRIIDQFDGMVKRVQSVNDAFEKEHRELVALRDELGRSTDVWKEDFESLLSTVSGLLFGDTRREQFDISKLKSDLVNARQKRFSYIDNMKRQRPWLVNWKRYRRVHEILVIKFITSDEYNDSVERYRRDRLLRIVLICIPVIGWIIFRHLNDDLQ